MRAVTADAGVRGEQRAGGAGRCRFRRLQRRRRRRRRETRRGGESGAVCVLLEKRTWGRESVCASSVTDRGEVWLGIGAGGVERQTAGAARWTGGERVRCARVCESSTSSTKGGDSACRSWVSVCVVGRGRGAPEKRSSAQTTRTLLPRASFCSRCEQMQYARCATARQARVRTSPLLLLTF